MTSATRIKTRNRAVTCCTEKALTTVGGKYTQLLPGTVNGAPGWALVAVSISFLYSAAANQNLDHIRMTSLDGSAEWS